LFRKPSLISTVCWRKWTTIAANESRNTYADAAVGPFCGLKKSFQKSKQIIYNHFSLSQGSSKSKKPVVCMYRKYCSI
jgi:hypothetical protein